MLRKDKKPTKFKWVVRIDPRLAMRIRLACVRAGISQQEAAARMARDWLRHERSEQ